MRPVTCEKWQGRQGHRDQIYSVRIGKRQQGALPDEDEKRDQPRHLIFQEYGKS